MFNRRRLLAAGAGGLVAAGLASRVRATTEPAPSEPAQTRMVDTDKGPVEIPASPARVVCADYFGMFPLVDIGVVPVGISGGAGETEPYATELADAVVIGDYLDPELESVASVEPDVILRTIDTDDQLYEQLSGIAPTVVVSFEGLGLVEVVQQVGAIFGRDAEAAELVATYEARGAELADTYADVIEATTWATVSAAVDSQWFLLSPAWTDNEAISVAGIRFSDAVVEIGEESDDYAHERSLEQLDLLSDADVLLVTATPDGGIDPSMDPIMASPLWATLPAVQAGNVFAAPQGTSSLGMAIALLDVLDDVLGQVTVPTASTA